MLYPGDTDRPLGYILLRVLMFWEFRKPLRNPETSAQMQKSCKINKICVLNNKINKLHA